MGELQFDAKRAERGESIFQEVMSKHPELGAFYRSVDRRSSERGFGAFISIPQGDWLLLNDEQRTDLGHFMCRESPINGWAVYVGRIDGPDIMLDDTGLDSRGWTFRYAVPDSRK